MANFLQKILKNTPPDRAAGVPAIRPTPPPPALRGKKHMVEGLPNATIIYGVAASVLFVAAMASFLHAAWFSGILVLAVAACLLGYALYFLRND